MGVVEKLETLASIETRSTFAGMAAARCATSADNSKNGRAWRGRPEKLRRGRLVRRTCWIALSPLLRFRSSPAHPLDAAQADVASSVFSADQHTLLLRACR